MTEPTIVQRLAHIEAIIDRVTLRDLLKIEIARLEAMIDERDRRYAMQFLQAQASLELAIMTQEKMVNATFAASDRAVTKSEDAQRQYNEHTNEFRGQLKDQAATQMPRLEAQGITQRLDNKIDAQSDIIAENRFALTKMVTMETYTARHDDLQRQVDALNISRATLEGKASQHSVNITLMISAISICLTLTSILLRFWLG